MEDHKDYIPIRLGSPSEETYSVPKGEARYVAKLLTTLITH